MKANVRKFIEYSIKHLVNNEIYLFISASISSRFGSWYAWWKEFILAKDSFCSENENVFKCGYNRWVASRSKKKVINAFNNWFAILFSSWSYLLLAKFDAVHRQRNHCKTCDFVWVCKILAFRIQFIQDFVICVFLDNFCIYLRQMFSVHRSHLRLLFISEFNVLHSAKLSSRGSNNRGDANRDLSRPHYEQILSDGRVFVKVNVYKHL